MLFLNVKLPLHYSSKCVVMCKATRKKEPELWKQFSKSAMKNSPNLTTLSNSFTCQRHVQDISTRSNGNRAIAVRGWGVANNKRITPSVILTMPKQMEATQTGITFQMHPHRIQENAGQQHKHAPVNAGHPPHTHKHKRTVRQTDFVGYYGYTCNTIPYNLATRKW